MRHACARVLPPPGGAELVRDTGAPLDLVAVRLEALPRAVGAAARLLSDPERERAGRFIHRRDRDRFVVARARLRELLALRLGTWPEAVDLVQGPHGKPALGRRFAHAGLHFSLSRCDDLALYAFSWSSEIGIDVEAVRPLPDADAIATRFFSPQEQEAYGALPPCERPLAFFHCWTRKEAFLKARGEGLAFPLHAFDVTLAPAEPARILRVGNVFGDDCGWSLLSFSPAPGYVAAVATPGAHPGER